MSRPSAGGLRVGDAGATHELVCCAGELRVEAWSSAGDCAWAAVAHEPIDVRALRVGGVVAAQGTACKKQQMLPRGVLFDKGCDYRDEIRLDQKRVQLGSV